MAEQPENRSDTIVRVLVYGLHRKERIVRLLDSLAEIPCCPSTIFRIDRFGRMLGVVDQLHKTRGGAPVIYYVRVDRWRDNEKGLPVIAWATSPRKISSRLQGKAREALVKFTSGIRGGPDLVVDLDVTAHAELHAIMAVSVP